MSQTSNTEAKEFFPPVKLCKWDNLTNSCQIPVLSPPQTLVSSFETESMTFTWVYLLLHSSFHVDLWNVAEKLFNSKHWLWKSSAFTMPPYYFIMVKYTIKYKIYHFSMLLCKAQWQWVCSLCCSFIIIIWLQNILAFPESHSVPVIQPSPSQLW